MSLRTKLSKPKKRERRELIWILSITCLLVVGYSIEVINAEKDDVDLKRYWILTEGELYDVKLRGKSASSYYSYEVKEEGYTGEYFHETRNVKKHFNKLKNIAWTVIYDSTFAAPWHPQYGCTDYHWRDGCICLFAHRHVRLYGTCA